MNGDIVSVYVIVNLSSIPALCLTLFLFHFMNIQTKWGTLEHSMHHGFSMEVGQELCSGDTVVPVFTLLSQYCSTPAHAHTSSQIRQLSVAWARNPHTSTVLFLTLTLTHEKKTPVRRPASHSLINISSSEEPAVRPAESVFFLSFIEHPLTPVDFFIFLCSCLQRWETDQQQVV